MTMGFPACIRSMEHRFHPDVLPSSGSWLTQKGSPNDHAWCITVLPASPALPTKHLGHGVSRPTHCARSSTQEG